MYSRCHLTSQTADRRVRALKLDNGEGRKRLLAYGAFSVSTQERIQRADTEALLQPVERSLAGGDRPRSPSTSND